VQTNAFAVEFVTGEAPKSKTRNIRTFIITSIIEQITIVIKIIIFVVYVMPGRYMRSRRNHELCHFMLIKLQCLGSKKKGD
jgi:hypothetical protein